MTSQLTRERLLASTMICGLAALAFGPPSASAAEAPAAAAGEVSEIVVTGTRIPSPNLTSTAPVTSVTAADIKAQGVARMEDLLNSLPQAFASQGSNVSNGSDGTANVNLRGLGPNRTLVLIDGKRVQAGNPTSSIAPLAADLNFIPSTLVERVDVLTGGASAVYGADAVAGVVNFIMKRNFEGVEVDAQYSFYQHNQQDPDGVQETIRKARANATLPDNFKVPGDFRGGEGDQESITIGVNAPDGKGNITAYATHVNINPVLASNFDYTACALRSGTSFLAAGCGGSGTSFPATIGNFVVDPKGPGNTFRALNPATDVFNFAPTNYLQRPDQRYSFGAFAHYEVNPHFQAYADLMFMEDNSTAQVAPGGIFSQSGPGDGGGFAINCDNPLLSAQQAGSICTPAQIASGAQVNLNVARRNIEGGGRLTIFDHQEQRYVVGLKGAIAGDWTYDAFIQYGKTGFNQEQDANFLTSRVERALIAKRNAQGQVVCQSVIDGTDPACVPYNLFQLGGVTPQALAYLQAPTFSGGAIIEQVASLNLTGSLPDAIKSPWANDRIGVSVGAEYRREHLDFHSDVPQATGDVNGNGAAAPPVNGGYDVYELFGEARVPLVQDQPFIKDLTAELAYRYSDYSNAGTTNTYKASADWTIIDGFRIRAGYNRAVRAPNVVELFSPQNVVLDGTVDPCAGLAANDPLVQKCASLFNLTTAQVLALTPDPAGQYNGQTGGNPNLRPETADTYTVGFVWQPSFLPGASLSVDWFDIKVKDFISNIGADTILTNCVNGQNPDFCPLVHRDAIGSLKSTGGFVVDTEQNQGGLHTSGLDVTAGYRTGLDVFGLQDAGSVAMNFVGSYLDRLETTVLNGEPPIDCAGLYGSRCNTIGGSLNPNPKWRHKMRVTWNTPYSLAEFSNLALSAEWRFFSGVDVDVSSSNPQIAGTVRATDAHLSARSYLDLLATFKVKDNYSFRIGVNNVLDQDPPLTGQGSCPAGACNQNVYAQMYDSLGRYVFMGVTADF